MHTRIVKCIRISRNAYEYREMHASIAKCIRISRNAYENLTGMTLSLIVPIGPRMTRIYRIKNGFFGVVLLWGCGVLQFISLFLGCFMPVVKSSPFYVLSPIHLRVCLNIGLVVLADFGFLLPDIRRLRP